MKDADNSERVAGGRRPISFFAGASWSIALTLVLQLLVKLTDDARPGAADDLVSYTACDLLAVSLVLFAMVRVYAPTLPLRRVLAVRRVSPIHVILSAVAGAGIAPAMAGVDALIEKRYPLDAAEAERQTHMVSAVMGGRATLAIALVLALPIAEELFFRGILFGGLRRGRTQGLTVLATTVFFACARLDPRAICTLFVLGLVLASLRSQSGSVISSSFAHAAFYAVPIVPILLGRDVNADFAYPLAWTAAAMGVAVVALVIGSLLSDRDAQALAARAEDR